MKIYADDIAEKERIEEIVQEHESDLTPRERRQREWARFKEMSGREKVGFFWDYYKWVLVVIVAVVFVVYEGIQIHHRLSMTTLLSLAIVDVPIDVQEDVTFFEQDMAGYLGSTDDMHIVDVDASPMSGDAPEAVSKLAVVLAAGMTDVAVLDEANYLNYEEQGAFMDWREFLGEDYEDVSQIFDENGRLDLSKNEVWGRYHLTDYAPAYCGVLASTKRPEASAAFPRFLAGLKGIPLPEMTGEAPKE